MFGKKNFEIIEPRPYERVGMSFKVSGWIPKVWLGTSYGSMESRVYGEFLTINGMSFAGTVDARMSTSFISKFRNRLYFSTTAQFSEFNLQAIKGYQGRIILKLYIPGRPSGIYLPLIVEGFEPRGGVDIIIEEQHKKILEKIPKYEIEYNKYRKELDVILKRRVFEHDILEGVFSIFENVKDEFKPIMTSVRDLEEEDLFKKYEEAVRWMESVPNGIGASVGRMSGFEFTVYSKDHSPEHFHVIHKGKGVEARFSYPTIELISYKGKSNTIGAKEIKEICNFFKVQKNFDKLTLEFKRQIS